MSYRGSRLRYVAQTVSASNKTNPLTEVNSFRGKRGRVSRRGPKPTTSATALRSLSYTNIAWPMKSILVIDGSEIFSTLFTEIFENRGWSVCVCSDRECAVERIAGPDTYDAVLLGYHVPGTTGVQLVRLIRSFEHRMMAALVVLTDSGEITEDALAAGADEVVLKPLNPHALVLVVEKHVSQA